MKRFYSAFLAVFVALFAASAVSAAPQLPSKPSSALKIHDGTQTIGSGKDSYIVTAMGGKVVTISPAGSSHMGGSMMSSKTVKFTKSSKNGICYYWWYSYGRYYYVWRYC